MLKLTKELQWQKASSPMWITEGGMDKLAKELQPQKAPSPMCVTEFGMVKSTKDVQLLAVSDSMCVTELEIIRLTKELHFIKAPGPMWVTEFGMITLASMPHSEKARSAMPCGFGRPGNQRSQRAPVVKFTARAAKSLSVRACHAGTCFAEDYIDGRICQPRLLHRLIIA